MLSLRKRGKVQQPFGSQLTKQFNHDAVKKKGGTTDLPEKSLGHPKKYLPVMHDKSMSILLTQLITSSFVFPVIRIVRSL